MSPARNTAGDTIQTTRGAGAPLASAPLAMLGCSGRTSTVAQSVFEDGATASLIFTDVVVLEHTIYLCNDATAKADVLKLLCSASGKSGTYRYPMSLGFRPLRIVSLAGDWALDSRFCGMDSVGIEVPPPPPTHSMKHLGLTLRHV